MICLFFSGTHGASGTEEDEVGFDFGSEIFTLDFDVLGEEGFGWGGG